MRTYFSVWTLLMLLLGLTVSASLIHFGWLNPAIAVGFGATKAVLIAAYFMHLRSSAKLIWIVAGAGVVWLAIMFTLTGGDYLMRGYLPTPTVWQR